MSSSLTLAFKPSLGLVILELLFLGSFTCSLSLSTFLVSLARVSRICLSGWVLLWKVDAGGFPVMTLNSSSASSIMWDSVIEEDLVSISIFLAVILALLMLLRRIALNAGYESV